MGFTNWKDSNKTAEDISAAEGQEVMTRTVQTLKSLQTDSNFGLF